MKTTDRELSQRVEKAVRKLDNLLKSRELKSKKLGETALYNNIPEKLRERKQIKFIFDREKINTILVLLGLIVILLLCLLVL